MSKNLTFKLILDGDNKGLISAAKQSEITVKSVLETIKVEAEKVKKTSEETNKATADIVSDDLAKDVSKGQQDLKSLTDEMHKVTNASKSTENGFNALSNEARNTSNITNETTQSLSRHESASQKLSTGLGGLKTGLTALAGAFAAVGLSLGVKELAQTADSYTNLSARINIATQDGGNFAQAMAGVHQVALATNSSLEATGTLFTKINDTGKQMGLTQQQSLDLTKTINQAIQTGGGSAQASEAAITQLAQALQSGVLRGDEFNSIMEQAPGLTKALASGLNVTTGELRKMAENGELSAERVVKAIQSQSAAVQADYDKFPTTIGNALQRISTSWEILIGKMDQANGASSIAAQWLSTLADNLNLLEPIIEDIGNGFVRFGEYYKNIYDQGTIDSLKNALVNIYETIKTLFNTVMDVGEAFHEVFSDALSSVFGFSDGLYPAGQQVSGFQKFIDLLNIAISFLNDGFKTIGIGVNLFTGTLYGLAAVWYELKSVLSWGSVKEEAIANMQAMQAKSQEYFDKGFDGVKNFGSKTIETIREIGKTDEQKNQDRIASNQKALDELKTQEEKHKTDYKSISDQRIQLEQQLQDARRTGNQAFIDLATKGLADLDAKEKAYHAESQKIQEAKISAAQDWVNAQLTAIDGTQKAADVATQKTLQTTLAAQGLKVEFDSTGKAIVSAMDQGVGATTKQADALTDARKGATALGLDLDVALNRVSEKFAANKVHLDNYANGLTAMGVKGTQATDALYQGWEKWAEAAKNQAEIDAAKAKLLEFEKQGVFSAKQVQMGMEYLDQVSGKIPENISEIEKAYKLLGVTSSAEASKMATAQLNAFNVMKQSGTATTEQLKQALINMADKVYASGNAAKIAMYESQLAANGLSTSVNDAGKVTVEAGSQMETSMYRVRDATYGARQGFRDLGATAREEALSSTEAWNKALEAQQGGIHATRKGEKTRLAFDQSGVEAELKAMGYDDKRATEIAQSILNGSKSGDGYKNASKSWLAKNGLDIVGSFAGGGGGTSNANYVREQLERYSQYSGSKSSSSLNSNPTSTRRIELSNGQQTASLTGSGKDVDSVEQMLSQFEMLKKSS